MTDTEIIKTVAEWCGLKPEIDDQLPMIVYVTHENGYEEEFEPLNNWCDLMKFAIPKLPERYVICICGGTFDLYDSEETRPVPRRGTITELPRAICELVCELAEVKA